MTQTIASDTFTGTNWSSLEDHTAEKGGQWHLNASTPAGLFYLYNGKTHCGAITSGQGAALYLPVVPSNANYSVFADYTITTTIGHVGIAGRMSATENTYYFAYADPSNVWVLAKRVSGVITTLDAVASPTSGTYAIELRMNGTSIALYVDTVLTCSDTDSSITAAGFGGVRSGSVNGASTGKRIDNFRIVDGSTAPSPRAYAVGLIGL